MLLQFLLILALSILGKDMTTMGKEEGGDSGKENLNSDPERAGNEPKGTVMTSGYVCPYNDPNWCGALEKRWLQETHAKVRLVEEIFFLKVFISIFEAVVLFSRCKINVVYLSAQTSTII